MASKSSKMKTVRINASHQDVAGAKGTIVNMNVKGSSNQHGHQNTKSRDSAVSSDPNSLLDTIESFHSSKLHIAATSSANATNGSNGNTGVNTNSIESSPSADFDPIEFLNHHYQTEASLISALPTLRTTLATRLTHLDDSISTTIQKQADLADLTLSDVARAKSAILELHNRITLVQTKARLSEKAVLEITRDMKRLDYAKKHLSRTITALKRLHMLLHAVTQLHIAANVTPHPDYKVAANLIDATRLLLGHFDGYMASVSKMRELRDRVYTIREELRQGVTFGFRVVGLGFVCALEKKKIEDQQEQQQKMNSNQNTAKLKTNPNVKPQNEENEDAQSQTPPPPMPPNVLKNACNVLTALGSSVKSDFMTNFCADHLEPYETLFDPKKNTSSAGGSGPDSSNGLPSTSLKATFKIRVPSNLNENSQHGGSDSEVGAAQANPNPASLDQLERRYAWYRRMLRELENKFPSVFPVHWNVHYTMTHAFLSRTGKHLLVLFSSVSGTDKIYRDRDCENVTVLLKALQKTILFEKEMTAWLQRDYGTLFLDSAGAEATNGGGNNEHSSSIAPGAVVGDDGEVLEFDESGKAVAASSAEGIRIKYERKMRERKKKESVSGMDLEDAGMEALVNQNRDEEGKAVKPKPVPPLIGVASSSFDKHMGPYIALEEQNMDEQLVESVSDTAVDTRGELPVFTSSTGLFVYIKNSVTRCTVLTRGRTFYLLYLAFKDTLRKYAQVLSGKLPNPITGPAAAISGITIAGVSAASLGSGGGASGANLIYRIPPGEETTICHVIDTCEYCVDTVEALQDLINDKIEDEYKEKINMDGEQEAFQDVTAKGIRVLVSGLAQRTEAAFREMSNINWSSVDVVGEESKYVRSMNTAIQPFVITVRNLLPGSYFRNFCDKFAATFTTTFYNSIIRCKRISESGTQQLLLDVYNLKTLMLKIPVLDNKKSAKSRISSPTAGSTIAPAMYTKMVNNEFQRIEILIKLVGTPVELLIDVFKAQWDGGSALDLQTVMNLKGMKRNEQAAMLEKIGLDSATAIRGASVGTGGISINENIREIQERSSDVAAKVNSDLSQMRQKVEDFRKSFR